MRTGLIHRLPRRKLSDKEIGERIQRVKDLIKSTENSRKRPSESLLDEMCDFLAAEINFGTLDSDAKEDLAAYAPILEERIHAELQGKANEAEHD